MMSGAKAIVESFKCEGVTTVFGYPGGAVMSLHDELFKQNSVRHILARHEQGAVHAAEGYAKASGKTGVCISTSGPGGTNLTTGIADAMLDSVPIVAISAQVATSAIGSDAFQEADMFGLMMPVTKHNYKLLSPSEIPGVMKASFTLASSGRPGPVHVDIPKDVLNGQLDFSYPEIPPVKERAVKGRCNPEKVKKAAELLANAQNPLIIAGGGAIVSGASPQIAKLAEILMAPVATTLMGKGAIDEYHPLSIGCVGMHGRKAANYAVHSCDLLLAIGMRFSDRTCGKFSAFAPHAKIIHAVIDPSEIGKNVRCDVPLVGDAKETLNALIETLPNLARNKTPWSERMREVKEAEMSDLESYDETPLKHQRVIHELSRIVDGRTILVTDVGQHQMWAMHHFKARGPRKFLSSGGLGTMGFALPAAVGAKAARPDEKVVAFVGDGGFLMTCQELATSAQENLPFICMVMNNGWLGMVRQWQDIFLEGRHGATNLGSKVDFVKVAQGLGCDGIRASTPGELRDALQAAEKADGTFVVEVMVDPQDSALPMALPGNSTSPGMMLCREKNSGDIFKKYPEGLSNKPADGSKGKGDANDFELVFDVANAG